MTRSFTEADVLGWDIADKRGLLGCLFDADERDKAYEMARRWDIRCAIDAPHRVCAVVPWTQEEDNDGE